MTSVPPIHPLTSDPTAAWEQLRQTQEVMRFKVKTPKDPVPNDKVKKAVNKEDDDGFLMFHFLHTFFQARVVCIADTHSLTSHIKRSIPNGDIFIHAGDFTR